MISLRGGPAPPGRGAAWYRRRGSALMRSKPFASSGLMSITA